MGIARRRTGISGWTVALGLALLLAVVGIVWVLGSQAAKSPDLTVAQVELPDAPIPPGPTPNPEPLPSPTPGPT